MKPSDSWCIPVTHIEHVNIHAGNIAMNDEEIMALCIRQMTEYLIENNVK